MKSIHGEFEFRIGCDYCPSFNINPQSVNSWEANVEQHMAPQTSCSSKKNTKMQRKFVRLTLSTFMKWIIMNTSFVPMTFADSMII